MVRGHGQAVSIMQKTSEEITQDRTMSVSGLGGWLHSAPRVVLEWSRPHRQLAYRGAAGP
jgi:hypothetical protein